MYRPILVLLVYFSCQFSLLQCDAQARPKKDTAKAGQIAVIKESEIVNPYADIDRIVLQIPDSSTIHRADRCFY